MPGPRPLIPGQLVFQLGRNPLRLFTSLARTYGDVVGFRVGKYPVVFVNHPDHVREILVTQAASFEKGEGLKRAKLLLGEGLLTSEGELHARQRRIVQPAFHGEALAPHAAPIVAAALRWTTARKPGEVVAIHSEMGKLTLTIAAECFFGANLRGEAGEIGDALEAALSLFQLVMSPFAPLFRYLPFGPARRFRTVKGRFDDIVFRLIRERRTALETLLREAGDAPSAARCPIPHDLLTRLLGASAGPRNPDGMSEQQLRDEILILFLAGHETTANALTWTWHLLLQHPEIEERLRGELREVLGEPGPRPPTLDDVPRLRLTRAIVKEAMRLYPPAWILGRRAKQEVAIGPWRIPPGTTLLASPWVLHHDARFFPAPDEFRPDRWLDSGGAAESGLPKYTYLPFGAGPRSCVGEPFAWMELVLVVATLASRVRFQRVGAREPGLWPTVTLRPRRDIPLRIAHC